MKKLLVLLLAMTMIVSACGTNNTSSGDNSAMSTEDTLTSDQDVSSDTQPTGDQEPASDSQPTADQEPASDSQGSGDDMMTADPLAEYVESGVLSAEDAENLMTFLEANDPRNGGQPLDDPLAVAAEQGIITEDQANAIDFSIMISEPSSADGQSMGPGTATASTYTVDEANAIEADLLAAVGYTAKVGAYPIVDTNQTLFFSNDAIIDEPAKGEDFYGQDASFTINPPSYTDNGDGTISDNVTGLMWQQDPGEKLTWPEAVELLKQINQEGMYGYNDWRIPSMKELYSLVDFSGLTRKSSDTSVPYIDTDYFAFEYGDAAGENRFIDSQILSSTIYDSTTLGGNTTVFGYNFADGRIKGYEIDKDFYCYFVRGNTSYGQNIFVDNGDGSITDEATSLMWSQYDSGYYKAGTESDGTLNWQEALEWVDEMNASNFLGYSDWRLPNIKELQSLVDYTKSPVTTGTPAIDDLFYCTPILNCFDEDDYGYYWSSTTHDDTSASSIEYNAASYQVFGNAMGLMNNTEVDAHGAGSQKSDPKTGNRIDYPAPDEAAPQGDEQRVYNMVRLVRTAE